MTQTELLEFLRRDPEKGIRAVISAFSALSQKTILRLAGAVVTKEDLEELVGDVFFQVYKDRDVLDPKKGSLATYVITLSRRRAVDALRKRGDPAKTPLPLDEGLLSDAGQSPEDRVLGEEQRRRLVAAIGSLGPPDSTIVYRRYYLGETYAQIGKRLGLTKNAANKRGVKALKKLRQIMEGGD